VGADADCRRTKGEVDPEGYGRVRRERKYWAAGIRRL